MASTLGNAVGIKGCGKYKGGCGRYKGDVASTKENAAGMEGAWQVQKEMEQV